MTPEKLDRIAEWVIVFWMIIFVVYFGIELARGLAS